jgi:hypothetical protein
MQTMQSVRVMPPPYVHNLASPLCMKRSMQRMRFAQSGKQGKAQTPDMLFSSTMAIAPFCTRQYRARIKCPHIIEPHAPQNHFYWHPRNTRSRQRIIATHCTSCTTRLEAQPPRQRQCTRPGARRFQGCGCGPPASHRWRACGRCPLPWPAQPPAAAALAGRGARVVTLHPGRRRTLWHWPYLRRLAQQLGLAPLGCSSSFSS